MKKLRQLSIFDNTELERAYILRDALKLREAVSCFQQALSGPFVDKDEIQEEIETCIFWEVGIQNIDSVQDLTKLVQTFKTYPFQRKYWGLKKELINLFIKRAIAFKKIPESLAIDLFDELLEIKNYTKAELLLKATLNKNTSLFHLLIGQLRFRHEEITDAVHHYNLALLQDPFSVDLSRIEDPRLCGFIKRFGTAMTPAYSYLYKLIPQPKIEMIFPVNFEHLQAMESLKYLMACKDCDPQNNVLHRKALKEANPELLQAYLNTLNK